jgi:translation initiation factor eIF-2B subunit alpha
LLFVTLLQLLKAKQDGVQEYVQLGAACELFMRYVTRTSNDEHGKTLDQMEFKRSLIRRGDGFKDQSIRSRDAIAKYGSAFVRDGAVVLLHGYSSVVMRLLEKVGCQVQLTQGLLSLMPFAGQRFS